MITQTQKTVLKQYRHLYFYLEDQPFYWKSDISGLEFKSTKRDWITWILGQLLLCFYVIILVYVAATHLIISPRQGFDIIKLATYFFMCIGILGAQAVVFTCLQDDFSFAHGYNKLLEFERNLIRFTTSRIKTSKVNIKEKLIQQHLVDWVIVSLVVGGAMCPVLVVLLCLSLDFDGYFFLFQDFFPDLEYITINQILCSLLVRMVLLLLSAAEIIRLVTFFATLGLIYSNAFKTIAENLTALFVDGTDTQSLIRLYTRIYLIVNVINERLDRVICIALSSLFWSSVLTFWACTKGYGKVDELLYFMFVLLSICFVIIPLIFFQALINTAEACAELLTKMKGKATLSTSVIHTKKTRWELREVKTLRKIKISFGKFFEVDTGSIASYFMQLIDAWASAVLLY